MSGREQRATRLAEMCRQRRLRESGVRWESPCQRWSLTGGGPKSRGCTYLLRDWQTGATREVRTINEAKEWVEGQGGARRVVVSGMPDRRRKLVFKGEKRVGKDRDLPAEEIERRYSDEMARIRASRRRV